MSNPITPGNRAHSHSHSQGGHNSHTDMSHHNPPKNMSTVTPNPHGQSSFQEEDPNYPPHAPPHNGGGGGGYPPPYDHNHGRERYPPYPVMPSMNDDRREGDSYPSSSSSHRAGGNLNGAYPPPYPPPPPPPAPAPHGYDAAPYPPSYPHPYEDRDRYGQRGGSRGAWTSSKNGYYGEEHSPHYEGRHYRPNGNPDRERDSYYANPEPPQDHPARNTHTHTHNRDGPYPPPPPPRNDIFRQNYPEATGRPSHRSDAIHSYVTNEDGQGPPPHFHPNHHPHHPGSNSSPERYETLPPGGPEAPMMYPQNVPRYERHYDDGYSGPPPQEHVRMVSPHRRGPMRQPHHRRQFSNESDDYGHTHTPPPHYHNHGYPPPPNYHYPPTSPLRRMHGPSPYPPHMPYTHHPPHPIPLTLTHSRSFESNHPHHPHHHHPSHHPTSTPPIIPQATHPTLTSLSDVNSHDVLCGRGGGTNSQIGNRRFRKLVQEYQPEYLVARRKAKPTIAKTIVQLVRQRGGRFLKKEEATGYLYEVGDERAEAKTSQALREGLDVRACAGGKKEKKEGGMEENGKEMEMERKEDGEDQKRCREEDENEKEELDDEFSPPRFKKQKMENSTIEELEEAPLSKKEESNHEKDDEQDTTVEEAKMWPATAV